MVARSLVYVGIEMDDTCFQLKKANKYYHSKTYSAKYISAFKQLQLKKQFAQLSQEFIEICAFAYDAVVVDILGLAIRPLGMKLPRVEFPDLNELFASKKHYNSNIGESFQVKFFSIEKSSKEISYYPNHVAISLNSGGKSLHDKLQKVVRNIETIEFYQKKHKAKRIQNIIDTYNNIADVILWCVNLGISTLTIYESKVHNSDDQSRIIFLAAKRLRESDKDVRIRLVIPVMQVVTTFTKDSTSTRPILKIDFSVPFTGLNVILQSRETSSLIGNSMQLALASSKRFSDKNGKC